MCGRAAAPAHHPCPAAAVNEFCFEPTASCTAGAVAVCGPLAAHVSDAAFEKVEAALLAVIVIPGQHDLSRGEYRGFSQR